MKAKPKSAKPRKSSRTANATAPAVASAASPPDECPKGGSHEWISEGDQGPEQAAHCRKCLEPEPSAPSGETAPRRKSAKADSSPRTGCAQESVAGAEDGKAVEPGASPSGPASSARKLSALDAAAQVLAVAKEPMACKALVAAMAAQELWTTPGGKTPHATLYSAILREIATKGSQSRFVKADRGRFSAQAVKN